MYRTRPGSHFPDGDDFLPGFRPGIVIAVCLVLLLGLSLVPAVLSTAPPVETSAPETDD